MFNKIRKVLSNKWVQLCIIISLIVIPILLISFKILPNNTVDAFNIVNLIVQSEAAVIAIVITLSLVAVQLAASSYSTRLIDIFKESRSFWTIVTLYIFAILIGLVTLISESNNIDKYVIQNFVLIDYYLAIVAFIALIPFIWITFNLLKPSTVISKLVQDITKEKMLAHISNEKNNEDPMQPIIDIVQASLIKYDNNTAKEGLEAISTKINEINNNLDDNARNEIIKLTLIHFKRISNLAISQRDEESLILIIKIFLLNGILSSKWKYNQKILEISSEFIKNIGNLAVEEQMNELARTTIHNLEKISKIAATNDNGLFVSEVIIFIENIIKSAIDKNLESLAVKGTSYIIKIQKTIIKKKDLKDVYLIGVVGAIYNPIDKSLEKENDNLAFLLLTKYFEVVEILIANNLKETNLAIGLMNDIRKKAIEKEYYLTGSIATLYLGEFYKLCLKYDNNAKKGIKNIIIGLGKNSDDEFFEIQRALIESLNVVLTFELLEQKYNDNPEVENSIKELNEIINKLQEKVDSITKIMFKKID